MPFLRIGIQVVFAQLFDDVNEKTHRMKEYCLESPVFIIGIS